MHEVLFYILLCRSQLQFQFTEAGKCGPRGKLWERLTEYERLVLHNFTPLLIVCVLMAFNVINNLSWFTLIISLTLVTTFPAQQWTKAGVCDAVYYPRNWIIGCMLASYHKIDHAIYTIALYSCLLIASWLIIIICIRNLSTSNLVSHVNLMLYMNSPTLL